MTILLRRAHTHLQMTARVINMFTYDNAFICGQYQSADAWARSKFKAQRYESSSPSSRYSSVSAAGRGRRIRFQAVYSVFCVDAIKFRISKYLLKLLSWGGQTTADVKLCFWRHKCMKIGISLPCYRSGAVSQERKVSSHFHSNLFQFPSYAASPD